MKIRSFIWTVLSATLLISSCSLVTPNPDKRFLGGWRFAKMSSRLKGSVGSGESWNNIVIDINKYANSEKTYIVSMFGSDAICSLQDDCTLATSNGAIVFKYDPDTKYLTLLMNSDSIAFTKLE